MSFKNFDKQQFIIDSANAFSQRKISKRDFLHKMGVAGIGLSAFSTGLLGGARPFHGNMAHAAENNTPEDVAKFLREVANHLLARPCAIPLNQLPQPSFWIS